jgi:hypothetical protein
MKLLKILPDGEIIYPYNILELKRDFPNTSFPQNIGIKTLNSYNIYEVFPTFETSEQFEELIEIDPVQDTEGKWIEAFRKEPMTLGKIEMLKTQKWNDVRGERNVLLKDSDFTMLEDFPQRGTKLIALKNYRQALRDITLQTDPFNITFPSKPI